MVKMHIQENIGLRESVGLKVKVAGRSKPVLEHQQGWSWFKSGKVWHGVVRRIDRKDNRYFEHIEDEQGEIVRHCEEPLTDHQGPGSAKWKKRKDSPPSS